MLYCNKYPFILLRVKVINAHYPGMTVRRSRTVCLQIGAIMSLPLLTLAQSTGMEAPDMFPFPFSLHIAFVCVATIFFILRFSKHKQPFQLIFAAAIPLSLLIWLTSGHRTMYYALGIIEVLLIVAALVSSIVMSAKNKPAKDEEKNDEAADGGQADDTDDAADAEDAAKEDDDK